MQRGKESRRCGLHWCVTPPSLSPFHRLQEQAAFFGIFGSLMDRTSGALEVLRSEGKLLGVEAEGGEAAAGRAKPSLKSSSEKQRKKESKKEEGGKRKVEALEKDGKKSKKDKKHSKSQGAHLGVV